MYIVHNIALGDQASGARIRQRGWRNHVAAQVACAQLESGDSNQRWLKSMQQAHAMRLLRLLATLLRVRRFASAHTEPKSMQQAPVVRETTTTSSSSSEEATQK